MRGDLNGLERIIKKSKRADKAGARLERQLAKRRKTEPPSNVDVAATRPADFATEYLPDTPSCLVKPARRALLSSGLYYVTGVCGDRALLVAPKKHECSRHAVVQIVCNATAGAKAPSSSVKLVAANVALLNGATVLEPMLFDALSNARVTERSDTVSVCRQDVNGVPLLMLTDSLDAEWPSEPADAGLTYPEFGKVQREAAKLLGLRLLTEWAM